MRIRVRHVFLAALAVWVGDVAAIPYTFTKIADLEAFATFDAAPSVNNSGTVAFSGHVQGVGPGIFSGNGGPITTIADTSGKFGGFFFEPAINDNGTVAFHATLDTGVEGIFTGTGGPSTSIADTTGPFFFVGRPSINNAGTVAFRDSLNTGVNGIFTGSGGATESLYDNSTSGESVFFNPPALNNNGTVAFIKQPAGSDETWYLLAGNGGPTTTIADTAGRFNGFANPISIDDRGTVAFNAGVKGGFSGIFTGSGGPVSTLVDSSPSGPFTFVGAPSINEHGTVAFRADLDTRQSGIYIGPDPIADKVIEIDDPLFDSRVMFIAESALLNEAGQIAFAYELWDQRFGIARADPVTIREPSPLALLVAVVLGVLISGRCTKLGGPPRVM
jgi:hypothetical protein